MFDGRMSWGETWALTSQLATDPTSAVGAAVNGLGHPVDLSTVVLADLWDLTLGLQLKKGATVKPYPRGWIKRSPTGSAPQLSQKQIRKALRARGHDV